jgi:hypothetical protein
MKADDQTDRLRAPWLTVLLKLLRIIGILLVTALGLYALSNWVTGGDGGGIVIGLSVLAGLPFILGAFAAYLVAPSGGKSKSFYNWVPVVLTVIILFLGGTILREGIVCIVMLVPLWMPMSWWGSVTVRKYQEQASQDSTQIDTFNASLVFVIPLAFGVMDYTVPQQVSNYVVARSVVIDAAPDQVWPLLLDMQDIRPTEGQWNIAQDWLGIPRPASAVVKGQGEGARRLAAWGDHISFEEHLTGWREERSLTWTFVFPNDSVHKYTDEHISPDGRHLRVGEGGYRLTDLSNGRTRIDLYTEYEAQTPVNLYARLWGEIILGGIQGNILAIIEGRATS